jgi:hypothetical protein
MLPRRYGATAKSPYRNGYLLLQQNRIRLNHFPQTKSNDTSCPLRKMPAGADCLLAMFAEAHSEGCTRLGIWSPPSSLTIVQKTNQDIGDNYHNTTCLPTTGYCIPDTKSAIKRTGKRLGSFSA